MVYDASMPLNKQLFGFLSIGFHLLLSFRRYFTGRSQYQLKYGFIFHKQTSLYFLSIWNDEPINIHFKTNVILLKA